MICISTRYRDTKGGDNMSDKQKEILERTEEQNKITTLATTHKQEMQEIKDSIPADYSVLSNNVTTILDTFADGVKNTASGAVVVLDDSSDKKCEIEILGKTVQDGEPTPDNPVAIKGAGESGSISIGINKGNFLPILPIKSKTLELIPTEWLYISVLFFYFVPFRFVFLAHST